jgi:hypothetical protein
MYLFGDNVKFLNQINDYLMMISYIIFSNVLLFMFNLNHEKF